MPVFLSIPRSEKRRSWAAAALVLLAAGCTDQPAAVIPAPETGQREQLDCTVSVSTGELRCSSPDAQGAEGMSRVIYGGQNSLVRLTASNHSTAGGVFTINVTVQNLLTDQVIGTVDGTTADPEGIRVFFSDGPTLIEGTGSVTLANPDGDDFFTAPEQPYFEYAELLDPTATSTSHPWEFNIDPGVERFGFTVYISAQVEANLVISELMANPAGAVQDSVGEYVELYNAGQFPVNLRGFYVRDNGSAADTIKSDLIVPASSYVVLARTTDTGKNGGVPAQYSYTTRIGGTSTNLTFSNSGADRFVLRSPSGVLVDSVSYSAASTVAKSGIARELMDLTADNALVDGANWADATSVYDATNNNRGTPGSANSGTGSTPVGPVVTVSVTPGNQTLSAGQTRQYSATGRDSNGQIASTTFTWSSTNESVATVSGTGVVTTVADGQTTIRATAANGVVGSTPLTVFTQSSSSVYRNHLEFGVPADGDSSDDILLNKTEYSLSYNSARGGPNWVSWDLNATHFGPADRCDCFSADPTLPGGATVITTSDYTGSGYSRGHMVMSEQRTQTDAENEATFLMTNVLPQLQDMNGGPWLDFENYTNDLARSSGREVYNIAGGVYSATPQTLKDAGRVAIPTHTWKIIVVMDLGEGLDDVAGAGDIEVIAVMMPNVSGIQSNDWPMYRTSVDAIEAATGYDFLSLLPDVIETAVEATSS